MIWYTSDQHFFHSNVIEYCKRPFKDVDEMNKEIIRRYNFVVKDDDVVYHIGDFTLLGDEYYRKVAKIVNQLKGIKHLIARNDDKFKPFTYVEMGFTSVHTALELNEFVLVHDPAVSCVNRDRTFLCGHIHELFKVQKNVVNVGLDVWDYYPVSIEQVREQV